MTTAPTISRTFPPPPSITPCGWKPTAWDFSTSSQKTLDLQRGVVQNEKRQDENSPTSWPKNIFHKNTYPAGHPYSWPVIGEMADLDAALVKDVQEWFQTYYGPSNAVIVLAGDIDLKTAKEKVEKYFGEIPPGPPVTHQQAWIAKRTGTHREVTQERVPLSRVYMLWNVPAIRQRRFRLFESGQRLPRRRHNFAPL